MDDKPLTPQRKNAALKDQLANLDLSISSDRTYLILAAIHHDPTRNTFSKIPCKQGVPIRGYVYDSKADAYFYECFDFLQVGSIPVSMKLAVRDTGWSIRVPLTEGVILKFLNESQFKDVDHFKSLFSPDEYKLEYVQLIDSK